MREMKDSGVEWIGKIPLDWELSKIGRIYEERNTIVSDADFPALSVTKQGIVPQLETAAKTDNGDNRKLIKKNDFVINSRSDRRGSCGISEYDGSCSLINTVLRPRRNMVNAYFNLVFHSELFADEFYKYGYGIVDDLWSTKWSSMKRIYIPLPSYETQRRIAAYLDAQCARIDRAIARQQEVIEKLKEYKLAVITEAVTKGLNLGVPMKDSGIEWIGEIPCTSETIQLRFLIDFIESGVSVNAGQVEAPQGEAGVLKTSAVSRFVFDPHENKSVNYTELNRVKCPVLKDNIIVSRMNTPELVGACGYVERDYPDLFLPDRLWQVHFVAEVNVKYIWYFLASKIVREYYASLSTGTSSSMQNISQGQFAKVAVVLPDSHEQARIVEQLDLKCSNIEKVISQKEAQVSKLTEYKKSLIYEVVTGKREV